MGINPILLPDHMKLKMDGDVRKGMGRAGMTREEAIRKFERGDELQEQKVFRAWLYLHEMPFIYSKPFIKASIQSGLPDFHVFRDGRLIAFEFKSKTGRISTEQEEKMDLYRKNGCEVLIVHTAAVAIEMTKRAFKL
jgi:hypothetical protein